MKYTIRQTKKFRKELKKMLKRGVDRTKLSAVVKMLAKGEPLPPQYHDHALTGDLAGTRDCHITPDWLLIYVKDTEIKIISLLRTGTHSDLFGKKKR